MQIRPLVVLLSALLLGEAAIAMTITNKSHAYAMNYELDIKNEHSGRTDSSGGHRCSDKSKRKGLCSDYHYH